MSSLLCDYSASSSDEEQEEELNVIAASKIANQQETKKSPLKKRNKILLPSANDLFSSTSDHHTPNLSSSHVFTSKIQTTSSTTSSMKKNMRTDTENTPDVVAKKSKIDIPNRKIKDQSTKPLTSSFLFAPPQLQRPNVSTEDVGAWNTSKTMQQRRTKALLEEKKSN